MRRFPVVTALLLACAEGCVRSSSSPAPDTPPHEVARRDDVDTQLALVAQIHGGAGPWAVAGYRMGEYALRTLALERGSFDLEVVHYTPHEVQYSCIADGAAAATGASLGKLNLTLADAPAPTTHTVYRRKSTGQSLTLRVTKAFGARFADVPRDRLADAGREVIRVRDEEIFEEVP
jgi:formylmethanofuran dehydrogenase subunit E